MRDCAVTGQVSKLIQIKESHVMLHNPRGQEKAMKRHQQDHESFDGIRV